MPFPGILDGFETHQKQFFEIFEAKEQKEKTVKNRKFRGNIGKSRKLSEKIGKNRTKEISVEISFRSPSISDISAEISEILFPDSKRTSSLTEQSSSSPPNPTFFGSTTSIPVALAPSNPNRISRTTSTGPKKEKKKLNL